MAADWWIASRRFFAQEEQASSLLKAEVEVQGSSPRQPTPPQSQTVHEQSAHVQLQRCQNCGCHAEYAELRLEIDRLVQENKKRQTCYEKIRHLLGERCPSLSRRRLRGTSMRRSETERA